MAYAVAVAIELGGGFLLESGLSRAPSRGRNGGVLSRDRAFFHTNVADQNQMINFLKNVMVAGGLSQIVAFGAGALSLDDRRERPGLASQPAGA